MATYTIEEIFNGDKSHQVPINVRQPLSKRWDKQTGEWTFCPLTKSWRIILFTN